MLAFQAGRCGFESHFPLQKNEVKVMTIQKVIKIIGICRLQEFYRFMEGQTVGMNKDGSIDYYKQDVDNFLRKKEDRFFD
jgi:hypothetical protein